MRDNLPPEEKLLKLIKGQKKKDPLQQAPASLPAAPAENKPFSIVLSSGFINKYLNFRKLIIFSFVLSCTYLGISLLAPLFYPKEIKLPKAEAKKVSAEAKEPKLDIQPFEYYKQGLNNKQIFSSGGAGTGFESAGAATTDIMKDINLVGIIVGDNPQAIVEDKKAQKTYYVTKGQYIGDYQVADILEGKIIVIYGSQKFELYL